MPKGSLNVSLKGADDIFSTEESRQEQQREQVQQIPIGEEFTAPAYESTEEEASPLMLRYQEAITTTDTYHETKRSFAWIGEIEDENLLAALEQLSDSDLELITLYAYEEYDTVEISKLFGTTKQNISKKIRRITNFIKNFQIRVV